MKYSPVEQFHKTQTHKFQNNKIKEGTSTYHANAEAIGIMIANAVANTIPRTCANKNNDNL